MAYLNPANSGVSLPQLPLGPLTGYLTGLRVDTANEMDKRMMRDDDLEYLINQIRQQSDQSNLAVTQANNQNALSQAALTAGQYADGTKAQEAATAAQAAIGKNQQSTVASQDAIRNAVAPDVVRMGEYIKANGGQLDPTNQADIDTWNQFSGVMQNHGIKVPAFPDQGDSVQMMQWAKTAEKYANTNAQAYVNTAPFQQEQAITAQKGQTARDVAGIGATAREEAAKTQATAHVEGAQISAGASVQRAQVMAESAAKASNYLSYTLNQLRQTGGVKPTDVPMLRQLAFDKFWNGPEFATFQAMQFNAVDPSTRAMVQQAQARAQSEADAWLSQDPTFVKAFNQAKQGNQSNINQSSEQPKSSSSPIKINGDSDYNALPSGSQFIGPDGVLRRKP